MSSSQRVRLEIECLDADQAAPSPAPAAEIDDGGRLTVLVVAAEADFRRYVRECLRERTDLRLLEAATVGAAVALAAYDAPAVLVVDEPEGDVVTALPGARAIIVVDDVPPSPPMPHARLRFITRPFSAQGLIAEVVSLLA